MTASHTQPARIYPDKISRLIAYGDTLENDPARGEQQYYFLQRTARNLLRYITLGSMVTRHGHYQKSLAAIEEGLANKRNPALLTAIRVEVQVMFNHALRQLTQRTNPLAPEDENQFEVFLSNLLALYPFLDPECYEQIKLPQKINGLWTQVIYQVGRIDISPQTGLLAKLLEEEDRLYAYYLTPVPHADAPIHLLLMGTTYPTGQGAVLADLYNFYPRHSVGEKHDTTLLDAWIKQQGAKKIKIAGHSKGATMAMIMAARFPEHILQADCLNPTGLCQATLNRLQPQWQSIPSASRPKLQVYAQAGDPAFPLENGFLEGTQLYRLTPQNKSCSTYKPLPKKWMQAFEAHIQHFAGRSDVTITAINLAQENRLRSREFWGNMKAAVNWVLFPIKYFSFCQELIARKCARFFKQHQTAIRIFLALAVLGIAGALVATVFLSPLAALPLYKAIILVAGDSIVAAIIAPKVIQLAIKIISLAATLIKYSFLAVELMVATLMTAFVSALSIGLKSLLTNQYQEKKSAQNEIKPIKKETTVLPMIPKADEQSKAPQATRKNGLGFFAGPMNPANNTSIPHTQMESTFLQQPFACPQSQLEPSLARKPHLR